jgi:hypothetical protein
MAILPRRPALPARLLPHCFHRLKAGLSEIVETPPKQAQLIEALGRKIERGFRP